MAELGDDILSGIRSALYERGAPLATRSLTIEQSELGDLAGVAGGCRSVVELALAPERLDRFLAVADSALLSETA
jgi:hypothetical protein